MTFTAAANSPYAALKEEENGFVVSDVSPGQPIGSVADGEVANALVCKTSIRGFSGSQ
jgi:hypothetical protein